MAIQAQLYDSENIGFPFCGSSSTYPQDWMMTMPTTATTAAVAVENPSCGGGVGGGFNQFGFNTQQKQQIHQFQNHHHQQKQSLYFENSISVEDEKQRQEIDHYIRSQNEKLRLLLQEERKQQLEMILKKIESKASTLLRQKDGEIIKANNRAMELEILLKKLEMENQAWQRMALEYESMVFSLNNTLEQMREKAIASCLLFNNNSYNGGGGAGVAEDAESCCDVEEEDHHELEEEEEEKWKLCKRCNSGDLCVVFLPCRHLCSCKACDAFLDSCPVCLAPKKASIEVLID